MTIRELRKQTGLTQEAFAKKYHIPKGTLANWEQGIRTPPEYVSYLLYQLITSEYQTKDI